MRVFLRGQSLVELLVAATVLMVGLAAAGNMIFSNARLQESSANQVLATNLAREGAELVKAVRDSNWVAGGATAFDLGLASSTDYTAVPRMDGGVFLGFDFTANTTTDATATIKRSTNAASPTLFVQGTGSTGSATAFSRLVTLNPICSDFTLRTSGFVCGAPLIKIGIRVTSVVRWTQRDGIHTTTVEEELYDWR